MPASRVPRLLVAAALAVVIPAEPAAALTLLEAVDRSIARSPEIAGLKSQVDVARARTDLTARAGGPQVGLDTGLGAQFSNLFGRGPATQFRRDVGARASQRLWDGQRTGRAVEAADKRAQAAALEVEVAKERLAMLSAEAYLTAVRRRQVLRLTQENITYHRWLVDVARERVLRNQLAKARLTELQARLAPLMVEKIEQEAELARALITLKELAGTTNDLQVPPELPVDARPRPEPDRLLPEILFTHPAMRRANLLVEAAERALEVAKAAYWPTLDATASSRYLQDAEGLRGNQWDNQAMLRLNWSLVGEDVPAQIREAEAARKQAVAQKEQAAREIAIEVRRYATTLAALRDQQRVLKDYQAVAKFSMDAGIDYVKRTARFATDMVALAELINVRYHAESNVLANRIDAQMTELRLLQAAGRLVPTLDRAYRR
ncbi:MAG: TolC family protein [Candidatus Sericytochromatia bacterium]|nr:TolC family protein [Candidatus Sericytochromatia bacterium]